MCRKSVRMTDTYLLSVLTELP